MIFTLTISDIENVEANLVSDKYTSSEALDCCLKALSLRSFRMRKERFLFFRRQVLRDTTCLITKRVKSLHLYSLF